LQTDRTEPTELAETAPAPTQRPPRPPAVGICNSRGLASHCESRTWVPLTARAVGSRAEEIVMELYYKDLISEEATLDKLVDDLALLVQGADEVAQAAGARVLSLPREEISTRLSRLKEGCRLARQDALACARATDRLFRRYPYSSLGIAFALGILVGTLANRRR